MRELRYQQFRHELTASRHFLLDSEFFRGTHPVFSFGLMTVSA